MDSQKVDIGQSTGEQRSNISGQCSATSEQSTNSQQGKSEQRAVRKLTPDTQEVDMGGVSDIELN